jgi:hypothetical protein
MKRLLSGIILALLVVSMLASTFTVGTTELENTGVNDKTKKTNPDSQTLSEPPPTEWNKTYGGTGDDLAYALVQTSDGGYALAGRTTSLGAGSDDFWLVKTDSAGNALWNKTYGGAGDDEAYALVQTSDGGYALTGYTNSFGAGDYDFWLVKTDSTGNMQWNKTYGGTNREYAYALVQTSDGGYALAGCTYSFGAGSADFWLVKTDSTGNMMWNKTYGGTSYDLAYALVQTSDGGYALAGYANSFGAGSDDFWLVKTDSAGNMQWNKTYGGTILDEACALVQTSDGGYALAGRTASFGAGRTDFWLVKTDSTGNMQWNTTYGGTWDDVVFALVRTSDGGYALAGQTNSFGAGSDDFWLVKTDSAGNALWNKTYGGTNGDYAFALVQTSDGGYALAGCTDSFGAGDYDFWLVKVGPPPLLGHDVAVTNVTSSKIVVCQGFNCCDINVTVANQGSYTETFNVTVYVIDTDTDNTTGIATFVNVTLAIYNSTNLTFDWNTTGFAKGSYTPSAYAEPVPDETDIDNNNFTGGLMRVSMVGDLTGGSANAWDFVPDGVVDGSDLSIVARCFGSWPAAKPPLIWNPNCDVNNDGVVDGSDLAIVARHFGEYDR